MTKFYNSAASTTSHMDGIGTAGAAISAFLGGTLNLTNDVTLQSTGNMERFCEIMAAVMMATVTVLERQYNKYLAIDITELLVEETRSTRSHNKLMK